jgi:hypothetical protein
VSASVVCCASITAKLHNCRDRVTEHHALL